MIIGTFLEFGPMQWFASFQSSRTWTSKCSWLVSTSTSDLTSRNLPWNIFLALFKWFILVCWCGWGTSGKVTAFCLDRRGSNPKTHLGFFQFRIAVSLLLHGVRLFLVTCNRMAHTLPSSFLFPIIIYHFKMYQLYFNNVQSQRKNKS